MSREDENDELGLHDLMSSLINGNSEEILEALSALWDKLQAEDGLELDEIAWKWNAPKPVNSEILEPFVKRLIELTTYESNSDCDYEIRMFATDFARWTDKRAAPALIAKLELVESESDMIQSALLGIVDFGVIEACDAIYNSIFIHDLNFDLGQEIIIDHCMHHLIALGKFDDQRAFDIIKKGFNDEYYKEISIDILESINTSKSQQILDEIKN